MPVIGERKSSKQMVKYLELLQIKMSMMHIVTSSLKELLMLKILDLILLQKILMMLKS